MYMFDFENKPETIDDAEKSEFKPYATMEGQEREGYGLSWHPTEGFLASGSNDGTICMWQMPNDLFRHKPTLVIIILKYLKILMIRY